MATAKSVVNSALALVKRAREASLGCKGSRLFNILPSEIRNMTACSVDKFKAALDAFLVTVPDQPTIEATGRAAETNSLIHQLAMKTDLDLEL